LPVFNSEWTVRAEVFSHVENLEAWKEVWDLAYNWNYK
jgi:hypothetical protein